MESLNEFISAAEAMLDNGFDVGAYFNWQMRWTRNPIRTFQLLHPKFQAAHLR
jgi:hypothetical protein